MTKKTIVANWKMNPESLREAKEWLRPVKRAMQVLNRAEAVICPPAIFLPSLTRGKPPANLHFGGQDAFWEKEGAYTGQLSPTMFKKAGASYLLVGHSETRGLGVTDLLVNQKIKSAFAAGLKVILCVGEPERDQRGEYFKFIKNQLEAGLRKLPRRFFPGLLVAYEPLWAISTRRHGSDTPQNFLEQAIFIRKTVSVCCGSRLGRVTPILYGGSVAPENAAGFLSAGEATGLLVGRESLRPDRFIQILKIAADQSQVD